MAAKPIPEGYSTITPYIVLKEAERALAWYKEALGAEEIFRMPGTDGRIMHGELRIGNSILMFADEFPEMSVDWRSPRTLGGTTFSLWVFTEDCDAMYKKAIDGGALPNQEPADMFWGDRYGAFTDPFGHKWSVATHKEDLEPAEMERRQREWLGETT